MQDQKPTWDGNAAKLITGANTIAALTFADVPIETLTPFESWAANPALGLTAATSRLLTRFIHGVSAFDPLVFAGMSAALLAIVLAATYIPARRATRVDPMVALRSE